MRPLGWDWKVGTAALASFPAREVVVGTLGILYNEGQVEADRAEESAKGSSKCSARVSTASCTDGVTVSRQWSVRLCRAATPAYQVSSNCLFVKPMEKVFTLRKSFEWRGLGTLADSALALRDAYAAWYAEKKSAPHVRAPS